MVRGGLRVLALVVMAALLVADVSSAAEGPGILLILDGSGSMWGKIQEEVKIDVLREVLADALEGIPDDVPTGLIAYGHRRRTDCEDVELIQPMAPNSGDAIASAVGRLRPLGMTPIAEALQCAALEVGASGAATVILVTDGLESCTEDPCSVIREVRQDGVDLTVHVVGIDLMPTEESSLLCITREGGGRYFNNMNRQELAVSVPKALDLALRGGNLVLDMDRPEQNNFQIFTSGEAEFIRDKTLFLQTPVQLLPGTYDLLLFIEGKETWQRGVEIRPQEETRVRIGGAGFIKIVQDTPQYSQYRLVDPATMDDVTQGLIAYTPKEVPTGTYDLVTEVEGMTRTTPGIVINEGETTVVPVTGLGWLTVKMADPGYATYQIFKSGEGVEARNGLVSRMPIRLPAGTYSLIVRIESFEYMVSGVEIVEDEPTEVAVAGFGSIHVAMDDPGYATYSVSFAGSETILRREPISHSPHQFPAGTYDVTIGIDGPPIRYGGVVVTDGGTVEIEVDLSELDIP